MTEEKLSTDDYIKILEKCVAAWNRGDAEAVASFYTDNLDYRDPTVPDGITRKEDFINYLKLIFKAWPEQEWIGKMVMPHDILESHLSECGQMARVD
jgi:ketosteroid isomerase-like protein